MQSLSFHSSEGIRLRVSCREEGGEGKRMGRMGGRMEEEGEGEKEKGKGGVGEKGS